MTIEQTQIDQQALLKEAGALMRMRPVPGADPVDVRQWLQRVLDFLHSPTMTAFLAERGLTPPKDFDHPVEDPSPALDHIADAIDSHEDIFPVVVAVIAVAVEAAYIGLVGYAIYTNVTQ
jgi:hypothetical protein